MMAAEQVEFMKKFARGKRTTLLLAMMAVALLRPAAGQTQTEPATSLTESQQAARELLMDMATYLAGLDRFGVKLVSGFDILQDDGQKIQFLEARDLVLARPDHFRAEEMRADGLGKLVLFDGSKVTVWDAQSGVFAQADQPGSVDDTLVYFERDLGMKLPLAALLMTRLPTELARRVRMIDYVEMTDVLGESAHHLAARTDILDFQVWIADGERPLPLRIVLTYPDAGRPQYWAQFSDWDLRPRTSAATFKFKAPDDARQVPFAVQFSMMRDTPPPAGATAEGAKQ